MISEFWNKHYVMKAQQSNDQLEVRKSSGSDWSQISNVTNGTKNGEITIRSKEMAEQLHFMLGQMLGK